MNRLVLTALLAGTVIACSTPKGEVLMKHTHADETSLRDAVEKLRQATLHLQVKEFTESFAEEADFHVPMGTVLSGKAAITAAHEKLFAKEPPPGMPSFTNATSTIDVMSLRFVRDDVAIVDWKWAQRGATMNGQPWPERRGIATTLWTRGSDGRWLVTAWRNKDFPTLPGVPTPAQP